MTTLCHVAESHDHLGSISLTLWLRGSSASVLRLAAVDDTNGRTLTASLVDDDEVWSLAMPVSVSRSFLLDVTLLPGQERYELRVPSTSASLPAAPQSQSFIHQPPLSGRELNNFQPVTFACSSCSAIVLKPSATATYADLPSEYWTEMLEAWMCHPEGNFLHQLKESRLRPTDGQILVGNDYLLVQAVNLEKGVLVSPTSCFVILYNGRSKKVQRLAINLIQDVYRIQ